MRKVSKTEIEALLHKCITIDEYDNTEDYSTSEESAEQHQEDYSIFVNAVTAKNTNPVVLCDILSTTYKNNHNAKTKVNKASTSEK